MGIDALLWDVDGTLAETERDGHRVAFNQAFEALDIDWRWDERRYGELLRISGGLERLLHDMQFHEEAPLDPTQRRGLAQQVHRLKNQFYGDIAGDGRLPLRQGVADLMQDCRAAGVRMGIVTTTSFCNVAALLGKHLGGGWRSFFQTVICAEEVSRKKPDPEALLACLETAECASGSRRRHRRCD